MIEIFHPNNRSGRLATPQGEFWILPCILGLTIGFFTNSHNWQYWHYCQLVFPYIYRQQRSCSKVMFLHRSFCPPLGRQPPGADTPPTQCMLGHSQQVGGMHPTGIQSSCSFILNICHSIVVNIKLYISGYKRIIVQGCRLCWSCSFLMAQLKQSWQYWHSCLAEIL